MEARIIEQTDQYIVHQDRYGNIKKYMIVDFVPSGYQIWNIGEHAPEGFVPLCKSDEHYHVDMNSLKAIRVEDLDDRKKIMDAAGWGGSTIIEAEKTIRENSKAVAEWGPKTQKYGTQKVKLALPALRKLRWMKR